MFAIKFSGIDPEAALNHFCETAARKTKKIDLQFDYDWDREKNIVSYGGEIEYREFCIIFGTVALEILQSEAEFSMEAVFDGERKTKLLVCYEDGSFTAKRESGGYRDEADFDVEDGYIADDCVLEEFASFLNG